MKTVLFITTFLFTSLLVAQEEYIGTYESKIEASKGERLKYILTLSADSTFTFHFFRNIGQPLSVNENSYGKGTWKVVNDIVYFDTNKETDIDTKYILNFTNTTGRFDAKNKSVFRFYRSDIKWLERKTLTKVE